MTGNSNSPFFIRESVAGENRCGNAVNPSLNWFMEIDASRVSKPGESTVNAFEPEESILFNKGGNAGN